MTATALAHPIILGPQNPMAGFIALATASLGTTSTFQFNAAGDKVSFIYQALTTTVPDIVYFTISTVTTSGSAGTIDVTLETLAADATPSGTPVTNSGTASGTFSTTGAKSVSGLAGTATITQGNEYAIVLTAGSGWNRDLTITVTFGTSAGGSGKPYCMTKDTAGAWTRAGGSNSGWVVGIADVSTNPIVIPFFCGGPSTIGWQAFQDSTNPDERGNRFQITVPTTCIGASIIWTPGTTPASTDDYSVALYSSHTATRSQLTTVSLDGEAQSAIIQHTVIFPSSISLSANTTYCIALKSAGTHNGSMLRFDYASAAAASCLAGAQIYSSTANNGSDFTDDNTKIYGIWPLLSKFDDGAGGGSSTIYVPQVQGYTGIGVY